MNYTVEYITLTKDLALNRAALGKGVAGIGCTYAGAYDESKLPSVREQQLAEIAMEANDMPYFPLRCFGSLELYANGAANVFIRKDGKPVAFLRVRVVASSETSIGFDMVAVDESIDMGT